MDLHGNAVDDEAAKTSGEPKERPKMSSGSFVGRLVRDFFLGCAAFLPLALFAFVTYYFFNLLLYFGRMFFGITDSRMTSVTLLALVVVILYSTGSKLRRNERWILNFIEQLISKIPVLGGWYSAFRDIVRVFASSGGEKGYMGTVAVPVGEGYIIGFVTKKDTDGEGRGRVTVFVPTSPNPTTGLVFFYPEEAVKYLDYTPEQAFSRIISLGLKD